VPRAQASLREELYRDDELVLVKGRFPLASYVGWSGGSSTIAVLPVGGVCEAPIRDGVASLEYRDSGDRVLSLVTSDGLCSLIGLVKEESWAKRE
jgi:hypothetical protein